MVPSYQSITLDWKDSSSFGQLPSDILMKILLELEIFDAIACEGVCRSWHQVTKVYLQSLQSFRYSLSHHVLRHRHWMEDNGEINAL